MTHVHFSFFRSLFTPTFKGSYIVLIITLRSPAQNLLLKLENMRPNGCKALRLIIAMFCRVSCKSYGKARYVLNAWLGPKQLQRLYVSLSNSCVRPSSINTTHSAKAVELQKKSNF